MVLHLYTVVLHCSAECCVGHAARTSYLCRHIFYSPLRGRVLFCFLFWYWQVGVTCDEDNDMWFSLWWKMVYLKYRWCFSCLKIYFPFVSAWWWKNEEKKDILCSAVVLLVCWVSKAGTVIFAVVVYYYCSDGFILLATVVLFSLQW